MSADPQIVELIDIASIYSGGTPSKSEPRFWGGDLPWLSAKDLKTSRVSDSIDHVTEAAVGNGTRAVNAGATLILVRGMQLFKSIPVALATTRVTFNQDVKAIVPSAKVDGAFLAYALQARENELSLGVSAAGHGTGRLATEVLESLPIWLPPLDEQRCIAAVLGTWDDAIATADRLARLLSRSIVCLGTKIIDGEKHIALADMVDVSFSGVDKHIVDGEQSVRLCNYMDVLRSRRITDDIPFSNGSATKAELARFSLRRDDVIFTKDSETAEDIAEAAYVADDLTNVVCGYHLALGRPKPGYSGAYISHAMRVPRLRQQFVIRANGAVRFGLTLDAVQEVRLPAPSLDRQLAIAAALDAADSEVASYRTIVALLRRQKHGLMRKLLSGDCRVFAPSNALVGGDHAMNEIAEAAE